MSWIKRMSVWMKLMSSFAVVTALTCIVSLVGASRVTLLSQKMKGLYELEMKGCMDASALSVEWLTIARDTRQAIIVKDAGVRQQLAKSTQESSARFEEALKRADVTFYQPECKEDLAKVRELFPKLVKANQDALLEATAGKEAEATASLASARVMATELIGVLQKMSTLKQQAAETAYQEAASMAALASVIMYGCMGLGLVLSMSLGYLIARWFTKAVVEVDTISESVASAAQELAAASEQLSSGAQQSASSLEETASSLEEMTATVRQNADNADQANQLANNSRETAEKGGEVVANAVKAMAEINQASKKIADIITTIDEIAFQTNLLALNAAVEAARAGEQGRGFAVVAGEVRNLAQRSATAAREIKGLIEDSVTKVETGSELVNQSGETLGAIVTSVKRVTDIVAEIAAASREQSAGIEQINKAVSQMDQVTQSNASQTEEMSGTAVALSGQAEQLQNVVAQFNVKKHGDMAATSSPSSVRSSSPIASTKSSKPSRKAKVKPAKAPTRELELVGAGVDGFEEF